MRKVISRNLIISKIRPDLIKRRRTHIHNCILCRDKVKGHGVMYRGFLSNRNRYRWIHLQCAAKSSQSVIQALDYKNRRKIKVFINKYLEYLAVEEL